MEHTECICPECGESCDDIYCESCLVFTPEADALDRRRSAEWAALDDDASAFLRKHGNYKLANSVSYWDDIA